MTLSKDFRIKELEQQIANLEEYVTKGVAFRDELQAKLSATLSKIEMFTGKIEPGQLIAEITCPSCGRALRVEHGDDEGEIGVLTNG